MSLHDALLAKAFGGGGSGGSASIDVTASVGQTIVVEEVDATGKPTKWKAADFPKIVVVSIKEYDENEMPIMTHTSTEIQAAVDAGYLVLVSMQGMLCTLNTESGGAGDDFWVGCVALFDYSMVFTVRADGSIRFE